MEWTCHVPGCDRRTFVVFEAVSWCHGHFLERVASTDADRRRAAEFLASPAALSVTVEG